MNFAEGVMVVLAASVFLETLAITRLVRRIDRIELKINALANRRRPGDA